MARTYLLTYFHPAETSRLVDTGKITDLGITWHQASGADSNAYSWNFYLNEDAPSESALRACDEYMKTLGYTKRTLTMKAEEQYEVDL